MEGSVTSSDEQWVYKDGAGYSWFSSTAIQTLKSKIKSNESYNVIINMEVDDFVNISKYISLYNQMNEDSEYKNCKFIIVSVNPINDTKATNAG